MNKLFKNKKHVILIYLLYIQFSIIYNKESTFIITLWAHSQWFVWMNIRAAFFCCHVMCCVVSQLVTDVNFSKEYLTPAVWLWWISPGFHPVWLICSPCYWSHIILIPPDIPDTLKQVLWQNDWEPRQQQQEEDNMRFMIRMWEDNTIKP